MMKKLSAIALAATMMLSLIGCSKKNFDGNYTAEVDLTDGFINGLSESVDVEGYEWKGSWVETVHLELSEGEYTYSSDANATLDNLEKFMNDNVDVFYYVYGVTEDELADYGYSSIWEYEGYETQEDFIADFMTLYDASDFEEKESGEYEIDGDSITLKGVDTVDEDGNKGEGWVLTYEDGNLTGIQYMDEDNLDEETEITFVRDAE
ncbi:MULTISPECIES: hypothetical protein [Butyrivibrio]|jgi:hypothetical protein|uniref:hypothetical protein n=1 Tax=Butyrivibrio TaxID=830 RepID=UPI0003B3E438|nr:MULTISPECIES: hypothetical protein [Butyrivibrio]SEQ45823.1 hypothetical protein SAMN02910382_03081 [Butyrivibrio sp. TB]